MTTVFKPHVTIPNNIVVLDIWAEISANSKTGLIIDGVQAGDMIEIQDISGICSFAGNEYEFISGFVGITAGILMDKNSQYSVDYSKKTNEAIEAAAESIQERFKKMGGSKRRDGYGQDPGTSDFAKNEGGIMVVMPEAKGGITTASDIHLKDGAKKNGRKPEYFSDSMKRFNSFFPCRLEGGQMAAKATIPGTIHLMVFDSKFTDNAGSYTMKCIITREKNNKNNIPYKELKDTLRNAKQQG